MSCEHRREGVCTDGRFGGRPSEGVCRTICDKGQRLHWPTVTRTPAPMERRAFDHSPEARVCRGCGDR